MEPDKASYDAPPTLAPSHLDLLDRVAEYVFDLNWAARGNNVAFRLSGTFDGIRHRCTGRDRIGVRDRDDLLRAIDRARMTALLMLQPDISRSRIVAGMRSLAELVRHWSENPVERASHPRGWRVHHLAHARILQNELHNFCLVRQLEDSAGEALQAYWLKPS